MLPSSALFTVDSLQFEKAEIKILNRSSKIVAGMKQKFLIEIEQNWTKIVVHYCSLPCNSVINCMITYKTVTTLSVEYCQILLKCMLIFAQNGWWVGLQTKNRAFFYHKMSLVLISFTTIHEKYLKWAPDFVEILGKAQLLKTITF
jgi:hypothetical protein